MAATYVDVSACADAHQRTVALGKIDEALKDGSDDILVRCHLPPPPLKLAASQSHYYTTPPPTKPRCHSKTARTMFWSAVLEPRAFQPLPIRPSRLAPGSSSRLAAHTKDRFEKTPEAAITERARLHNDLHARNDQNPCLQTTEISVLKFSVPTKKWRPYGLELVARAD